MAIRRYVLLADLHASDNVGDTGKVGTMDGWSWRNHSNWNDRLSGAIALANLFNVDGIFLVGDVVASADVAATTKLAAIADRLEAETSAKIGMAPGNHDIYKTGGYMTVNEWGANWYTRIAGGRRYNPAVAASLQWPRGGIGGAADDFTSFLATEADHQVLFLWGAAEGSWDTGAPAAYEYDADANVINRPQGAPENQQVWVTNTVAAAVTKPLIVICHEPIYHGEGAQPIDAGVRAALVAAFDTLAGANPVHIFVGHLHKVTSDIGATETPGIYYRKRVSGAGAVEHDLRGSVITYPQGYKRGNTVYLAEIDMVTGDSTVTPYYYSNSSRPDRHSPTDLDHVMNTQYRGRRRHV